MPGLAGVNEWEPDSNHFSIGAVAGEVSCYYLLTKGHAVFNDDYEYRFPWREPSDENNRPFRP